MEGAHVLKKFASVLVGISLASALIGNPASAADKPGPPRPASSEASLLSTAASNAYLTRSQYLTNYPNDSMPASCITRVIWLDTGIYDYGQYMDGRHELRGVWRVPVARNHTWRTCLKGRNGGYYTQDVTLNGEPLISYGYWIAASGNHTWGAFLDPPF